MKLKKVNWDNYEFHCSSLPDLMTNGKAKDTIGETTKSKLREIWIEERFGRKKFDSINRYTIKGTMVESDSLELYSQVSGQTLFKNNKQFHGENLVGTPDVASPLTDIKSSWDIFTFMAVDLDKAVKSYWWQMVGYTILTDVFECDLVYALVDTPEKLANQDMYLASFEMTEEQIEQMKANYTYGDIEPKLRIKKFHFNVTLDDKMAVRKRLLECIEYLKQLDQEFVNETNA